jgi:hypothetical protein
MIGTLGLVNRWGKWMQCKIIGWCEYGTRYRLKYRTEAGSGESLCFPEQFREVA